VSWKGTPAAATRACRSASTWTTSGATKAHPNSGVEAQQLHQRVHGAAKAEVTAEGDVSAIGAAALAADGVEVEKSLGRVLAGAVSRVDDRHRRHRRGPGGGPGLIVAEDDDVGVGGDHPDGVL